MLFAAVHESGPEPQRAPDWHWPGAGGCRNIAGGHPLTDHRPDSKSCNLAGWWVPNAIQSTEATRVHHAARRRGSRLAALSARAAAGDAGGRISNGQTSTEFTHLVTAFRRGLSEGGFVEGQNVAIEFRWADRQYDLLPALAADLVRRQVSVIVGTGGAIEAIAASRTTRSSVRSAAIRSGRLRRKH